MLAGFLAAMRTLAPAATFTCSVPFPLEPLRLRFPEITWIPHDEGTRRRCIAEADVWLGLGGSPFQNAQSRWFIDHLVTDAATCEHSGKPMFFLGIGVQSAAELEEPSTRRLCQQSAAIWTRDAASAEKLQRIAPGCPVTAAADLAHAFFSELQPPPATAGRVTLVPNFDYGSWTGQDACLAATRGLSATERIWLAQESRDLPGAERALFAALSEEEQARWQRVIPDEDGIPLSEVLTRWPSGEWLITSRYHAAIAGAWAGSKVVVIGTNEKLRSVALDLGAPLIEPDADTATVQRALAAARPVPPPQALAAQAEAACTAFIRSAVAPHR